MSRDGQHTSVVCDAFITAAITRHALAHGAQTALSFGPEDLSYAELDALVADIASRLQQRFEFGSKLALCLPNSPMLVLLFLGGVRAGCEVQVFDREWPGETVEELLAQLSPALLITDRCVDERFTSLVVPSTKAAFHQVPALLESGNSRSSIQLPVDTMPFYTGFTSGSTGPPKGFRRDHRSWLQSFKNDRLECPLDARDIVVAPGALSHSLFLYALVHALHVGAQVVVCQRFTTHAVARAAERHAASILYSVPVQLAQLCKAPAHSFATLRRILSSGAKLSGALRERVRKKFAHVDVCEFYGASELSFMTISKSSDCVPAESVGRAFAGVRLSIRDEMGAEMPAGQVGHVFVESDMIFIGYAQSTDELPRFGSAMSVGDLGYLDKNGCLFLQGRADRMIVSAGKNIYPEEVERVLQSHPAVQTAAVIAAPDEKRGKRLVAIVQFNPNMTVRRAALVSHCREHLPLYKVPQTFGVCTNWRCTRSGKTDFAAIAHQWRLDCLGELK